MVTHTIAILGGSGFVGTALCARLARDGHTLRVLTRRREQHRHLLVLPTLQLSECNIFNQQQLEAQLAGCDVVINLVGILNEKAHDGSGFRRAHVEVAAQVVNACRANGITRLLQMSALGADAAQGPSHYLRTKGEAEDLVHASGLKVTSFRPSVIFGAGDSFLNRFNGLLALAPLLPLACPTARFAPIHVTDVVEAFARALDTPATIGQRYDLCGPNEYTLLQLVRYTAAVSGKRRLIVPLPDWASRLQAEVFEWLPGKPFSRDNYLSTRTPSVCSGAFPALFGISPTPLEQIAPHYLGRKAMTSPFNRLRTRR